MQFLVLLESSRVKAAQKHVGEIDPYVGQRQTTQSKRRRLLANRRSSAESVAEIVFQQRLGIGQKKHIKIDYDKVGNGFRKRLKIESLNIYG